MNRPARRTIAVLVVAGALGPGSAFAARAGTVAAADTILRLPEPADLAPRAHFSRLGPDRALGGFAGGPGGLLAQQGAGAGADSTAAVAGLAPARPEPDLIVPVAGAVVGGAVGFFGGGFLAAVLVEDESEGELDVLAAFVVGALAGEVILMPLGAHLGNRRRGSYAADLGVSVLTGVAAIGLMAATDFHPAAVAGGTVLHVGLTVGAERGSSLWREGGRGESAP
jgi:hypothetical protein